MKCAELGNYLNIKLSSSAQKSVQGVVRKDVESELVQPEACFFNYMDFFIAAAGKMAVNHISDLNESVLGSGRHCFVEIDRAIENVRERNDLRRAVRCIYTSESRDKILSHLN